MRMLKLLIAGVLGYFAYQYFMGQQSMRGSSGRGSRRSRGGVGAASFAGAGDAGSAPLTGSAPAGRRVVGQDFDGGSTAHTVGRGVIRR